jgi:hypothetical protein
LPTDEKALRGQASLGDRAADLLVRQLGRLSGRDRLGRLRVGQGGRGDRVARPGRSMTCSPDFSSATA